LFNLRLTAEQLEFRDTVRDFVQNEVKPAALHPDRLQPFEKPLLTSLIDEASHMGLRTLALSETAGGAGADALTSCIVLEELAAGDVDLAMVLNTTSHLGHILFDELVTPEQRNRFLPAFLDDRGCHIALAAHDYSATRGWNYHRPHEEESGSEPSAVRHSSGAWVIDGEALFVQNAPVAKLLLVQVRTDPKTGTNGVSTFLVPAGTADVIVGKPPQAVGATNTDGEQQIRWHHGTGARVQFRNCRVPSDQLLGHEGQSPFASGTYSARAAIYAAAINLGVGRAAHEAAIEYSKLRIQGGRPIVQHQAIGKILADNAIRLELARSMIWKAAWVSDHPEAVADRSVPDLPLHIIARAFTAEAMHEVTLSAAECFGAMGVMRDMPMQKYVHDALVLLHSVDNDSATPLQIAEVVAGYERPAAA